MNIKSDQSVDVKKRYYNNMILGTVSLTLNFRNENKNHFTQDLTDDTFHSHSFTQVFAFNREPNLGPIYYSQNTEDWQTSESEISNISPRKFLITCTCSFIHYSMQLQLAMIIMFVTEQFLLIDFRFSSSRRCFNSRCA